VHLVGFIAKKFVTMHGHTNVKKKPCVLRYFPPVNPCFANMQNKWQHANSHGRCYAKRNVWPPRVNKTGTSRHRSECPRPKCIRQTYKHKSRTAK